MLPVKRFSDQGWFPSVFNDFFNNDLVAKASASVPSMNIIEDEKGYNIEVAAPGADKKDFNVSLSNNKELVVKMEHKSENEEKKDQKYLRHEFSYTQFEHSFIIPDNVDKDSISADMNNGVLTIRLPKCSEDCKDKECRAIEIN
ncbi:MAG: Hsp20/alpha crystallin family protein [Prevotellaceae bacterium]|nr:Hsp20/alpha crystallin family protein [Prevotellaceae bacterium]